MKTSKDDSCRLYSPAMYFCHACAKIEQGQSLFIDIHGINCTNV